MARTHAAASALIAIFLATRAGRSQTAPARPEPRLTEPPAPVIPAPGVGELPIPGGEPGRPLVDLQNAPPPPTNVVYVQYGVAFTTEVVTAAGPMCDNRAVPCILGPGGGVAIRAGWRGTGPWYLGGAYELSKQDPNKLLRLAILQQARFEGRYYLISGREIQPYLAGGGGVAGYGNEWGIDTWGPAAFVGVGVEAQITRRTVVGMAMNYRLIYFQGFRDTTGADRAAGVAQLFGLDFVLEQRDPIFTGR